MRVLIIEDDNIFGDMVSLYLTEEDFYVRRVLTGQEGLVTLEDYDPDVVLLDLVLPDIDGIEVCKLILEHSDIPIIIVSMNDKVSDKIKALTAGAVDYIAKPFSMQELKARILVAIRKTNIPPVPAITNCSEQPPAINHQSLPTLDIGSRTLYFNNNKIETTFSEFEILKLFLDNPERVFSRDDLITTIRGFNSFTNDRSIDVHITNLRKKIELNPRRPKFIKTIWGVGYKFTYEKL